MTNKIIRHFNPDTCTFEPLKTQPAKLNKTQKKTLTKIIDHAQRSLYRMNAQTADIYAFSYSVKGTKYLDGTTAPSSYTDWSGGWDWSHSLVDTSATHILNLETLEVYELL